MRPALRPRMRNIQGDFSGSITLALYAPRETLLAATMRTELAAKIVPHQRKSSFTINEADVRRPMGNRAEGLPADYIPRETLSP
jgi:hypothetical protein